MRVVNSIIGLPHATSHIVIDATRGIGYFGGKSIVDLATLTIIGQLPFTSNVIASTNDNEFAYFIPPAASSSEISKLSFATRQIVNTFPLPNHNWHLLGRLPIDTTNGFIYGNGYALSGGFSQLIKINTATGAMENIPLDLYQTGDIWFGIIDISRNCVYFEARSVYGQLQWIKATGTPFALNSVSTNLSHQRRNGAIYGNNMYLLPAGTNLIEEVNLDTGQTTGTFSTSGMYNYYCLIDGSDLYVVGYESNLTWKHFIQKFNLATSPPQSVDYLQIDLGLQDINCFAKHGLQLYVGTTGDPSNVIVVSAADPPSIPTNFTAVCVKPSAPTAGFSRDNPSGKAPLTVQFSNATTGTSPMTYLWQFGDGATSTEISPSHQYTQAGTYKVTLRATNSLGESEYSAFVMVFAADIVAPPNATITAGNYVVSAGQIVNFTGSAGADTYLWNFGDGQTSSSQNPSHSYTAHGIYTVTLTITKDGVWTSVAACQIVVTAETVALPPVVTSFGASNTSGSAGLTVSFNPVLAGGAATSYLWDFGDGYTSTGQNPSHQYTQPGIYTVTLTVTNQYGFTTSTIQIIVVALTDQIGAPGGTSTLINGKKAGYYIVDSRNHRVLIYERAGGFISWFGGLGNTSGKFNLPTRMTAIGAVNLLEKTEIAN